MSKAVGLRKTCWLLAGVILALSACGQTAPAQSTSPAASAAASTSASVQASAPVPSKPAAAASAAASGVAAGSAAAKAPTQLKAAYVPVVAFLPLYRAVDKGYFADEGIDLDLTIVQSASNAIAFLGSGQLDVAFGNVGDSLFNAVNRGVNVRIVGGITYSPHDPKQPTSAPIVVRKQLVDDGTIKSASDLKGRKIALNAQGGIQEYLLTYALQPANLTTRDVQTTILAFPDMPAALKNGAVDAAEVPEPFLTTSLTQGFGVTLIANPKPDALITMLALGSNLLAPGKEGVVNGLLKALRRSSNELQNPEQILSDENVAIWSKWSKIPPAEIKKQVLNVYAKDLALDVSSLTDQQQVLLQAGRLEYKQALPESTLIDPKYTTRK